MGVMLKHGLVAFFYDKNSFYCFKRHCRAKRFFICCLYYKHVTIVSYTSSSVNKVKASLNDDARVIIYNCHVL
jgi:hypothetical protein